MRKRSWISYFFAGIFCVNGLPHLVVGFTGRHNMTPFGRNSSPQLNIIWGCINFLLGLLCIRFADKQEGENVQSGSWLVPYGAGNVCWTLFGFIYSFRTQRKEQKA